MRALDGPAIAPGAGPGSAAALRGRTLAAPLDHARLWMAALVIGFLAIGVIFKSFVFVDGEPVVVNYIFNGLFIGGMLAGLLFMGRIQPIGKSVWLLLVAAIAWITVSSAVSGIAMNYVATFAMVVMLAGCFYAVPVACLAVGFEPWRLINLVALATVLISAAMFVVFPAMTIDPDSGRFSGFFISVAIACNFFFLSTVFSVAAALRARNNTQVYLYIGAAILAFFFLYITRTRSVLVETMFCVLILCTFSPMRRGVKMLILAVCGWVLLLGIASGTAVTTGLVSIDDQMQEFRLADGSLTDARNRNWDFGLERIAERPLFGEGLLTKQTEGGTRDINLGEGGSYNQLYDPHSLPLSLAVQGGIPFMLAIMGVIVLVLLRFVKRFGLVRSLQSPDFVLVATHFPIMMLAGGDLTTLGNIVEKIFWVLVGSLEIKNALVAPGDERYRVRPSLGSVFGHSAQAPARAW